MAFEIPSPKASPDTKKLLQELQQEPSLRNSPATNLLRKHIQLEYEFLKQNHPQWTDVDLAYALAHTDKGFFREAGMYGELSEAVADLGAAENAVPMNIRFPNRGEARSVLADPSKTRAYIEGIRQTERDLRDAAKASGGRLQMRDEGDWIYASYCPDRSIGRSPNTVRVYFSPRLEDTPAVLHDLLRELPTDTSWHIKTAEVKGMTAGQLEAATGRADKIIVYTTNDGAEKVLAAAKRVHIKHEPSFRGKTLSAGSHMELVDGIGVAPEKEGSDTSATKVMAEKMSKALNERTAALFAQELRKHPNLQEAIKSPQARLLFKFLRAEHPVTQNVPEVKMRMKVFPAEAIAMLDTRPDLLQAYALAEAEAYTLSIVEYLYSAQQPTNTLLPALFSKYLSQRLNHQWRGAYPQIQQSIISTRRLNAVQPELVKAGYALGMYKALQAVPSTSPDFVLPELLTATPHPQAKQIADSIK